MTASEDFWNHINMQLEQLRTARNAADVVRICPAIAGLSSADGLFGGSGGDGSVLASLQHAGWGTVWVAAHYHWAAQSPEGDYIEYVEGDLFASDSLPRRLA